MNVVVLQVFVSLALVCSSILLFLHSMKQADHEHADRLALLPMESDQERSSSSRPQQGSSRSPSQAQEGADSGPENSRERQNEPQGLPIATSLSSAEPGSFSKTREQSQGDSRSALRQSGSPNRPPDEFSDSSA